MRKMVKRKRRKVGVVEANGLCFYFCWCVKSGVISLKFQLSLWLLIMAF